MLPWRPADAAEAARLAKALPRQAMNSGTRIAYICSGTIPTTTGSLAQRPRFARRLPQFLKDRPVPFFTWLRQIGLDRLADCHRRHLYARARSVFREEDVTLTDDSVAALAARLTDNSSGPSQQMSRREQKQRMRACLEQLRPPDRELLLMRFVEHLQINEIAGALQVSHAAAKARVRRALENLQRLLKAM